ncbi:TatD family hydrolase [Pasteurellaceae bacterium LIM206]|nr:TatD family hydrolase [Pasteurellaceae bacterium LIM206]
MPFFDTHTHLDYLQQSSGEPLARLVVTALQADVRRILMVAVMRRNFKTLQNHTALFPDQLCYGLGLHPLYIRHHESAHLDELERRLAARDECLAAVGEIGLERGVPELLADELWRKQCDYFEAQLQLAKGYNIAVNIHSRKAHDQIFTFLKRVSPAKCGVIHGFAGSYEQAKRFVDLGYKIGVGGTITYERANKTRRAVAKLPLDALLLETDTPDMPVFGFQGQPNRPERIVHSFRALCALRTESPAQIEQTIWQNSCDLFS